MKIKILKNEKGQIAVFLMVGFTFFVALLSIAINTSILTAQKVKLQNTADIAALAGANVLRENLNEINITNKEIEIGWATNQFMFVFLFQHPCQTSGRQCWQTGCKCTTECKREEEQWQERWIDVFRGLREERASKIYKIIKEANEKAYKKALKTILEEGNLPKDILVAIKEKYGGYPGSETLMNNYGSESIKVGDKNLSLKEIYALNEPKQGGDYLPLFNSANEQRPFYRPQAIYTTDQTCSGCLAPLSPTFSEPCGGFIPKPMPRKPYEMYSIKVLKNEAKEAFYLTALSYQPLYDFNVFRILYKGVNSVSATDKRDLLFDKRKILSALSLAKPDGGSLGNREPYGNVTDFINPSTFIQNAFSKIKNYDKNKIIGFADKEEIDFELNDGAFSNTDIKKEDIWH